MGGKDTVESLIHGYKKHNEEEEIGDTKVIWGDLQGDFDGSSAVTFPEACRHECRWVLYEMGELMVEYAEKLSSTDLVTEFKTAAINVTQMCIDEPWKQ